MIEILQAIQTRWAAVGLTAVLGELYLGEEPENSQLPYCILTDESDDTAIVSVTSEYGVHESEVRIWGTSLNQVGTLANAVADAFRHASRAITNPMVWPNDQGTFVDVCPGRNITFTKESDGVYSASFSLQVFYATPSGLTPA